MGISLKNYITKYLAITIFFIVSLWAALFYVFLLHKIHQNVDDGLRNQKILILREVYANPELLATRSYGVNEFFVTPIDQKDYIAHNEFSNQLFYMPYDDEEEPYRVLVTAFYAPNKAPYRLEIRTSTVETQQLIVSMTAAVGLLYVLLMVSVFAVNRYFYTKTWRPFDAILNRLQHYRVGEYQAVLPLPEYRISEFQTLSTQVTEMMQRNDNVYKDQNRFIENASHELQTPLTILTQKIDLVMDEYLEQEALVTKLAAIKSSVKRMVELNKSLLLMSRIDNGVYLQTERVDLSAMTQTLIDTFADVMAHKGIQCSASLTSACVVEGNEVLCQIVVSNLLRNAMKYTPQGGEIVVHSEASLWQMRNSSRSGALPRDYIFQRFYKGESDSQSNGLGLSIVQSIVDISPNLSLDYSFENNFHIFSIRSINS